MARDTQFDIKGRPPLPSPEAWGEFGVSLRIATFMGWFSGALAGTIMPDRIRSTEDRMWPDIETLVFNRFPPLRMWTESAMAPAKEPGPSARARLIRFTTAYGNVGLALNVIPMRFKFIQGDPRRSYIMTFTPSMQERVR